MVRVLNNNFISQTLKYTFELKLTELVVTKPLINITLQIIVLTLLLGIYSLIYKEHHSYVGFEPKTLGIGKSGVV